MASSTTIPSTKIKPNKLIMFKVTPNTGIIIKAPIKEMGMPINTQKAMDGLRNKVNKASTNMPPCKALVVSVEIRFFTI